MEYDLTRGTMCMEYDLTRRTDVHEMRPSARNG